MYDNYMTHNQASTVHISSSHHMQFHIHSKKSRICWFDYNVHVGCDRITTLGFYKDFLAAPPNQCSEMIIHCGIFYHLTSIINHRFAWHGKLHDKIFIEMSCNKTCGSGGRPYPLARPFKEYLLCSYYVLVYCCQGMECYCQK